MHQLTSVEMLRINHTGEICAQALYAAQSIMAQDLTLKEQLIKAGQEEYQHLKMCQERLTELGGKTSVLAPAFALGAFSLGIVAGLFGEKINLAFLAETENQVAKHLACHLEQIGDDVSTKAIFSKMQQDEALHAHWAASASKPLPKPITKLMQLAAKVMTSSTRFI